MFWNRKKKTSPNDGMRELLFADVSLQDWIGQNSHVEPWASFSLAKACIDSNEKEKAIEILKGITNRPGLEPRHYLHAFHHLRFLGHVDDRPIQILGVLVEFGIKKNEYELLAAYSDLSVRYFHYSGAGTIWEHPNDSLDSEIKAVLELAWHAVEIIGAKHKWRPDLVGEGAVRINLLTSKGYGFGIGPYHVMQNDPVGGVMLSASMNLMQALIAKTATEGNV